jgi:hypothetical protein
MPVWVSVARRITNKTISMKGINPMNVVHHNYDYASNTKANTGVALGASALGVATLNATAPGGILDRFFGGCRGGGDSAAVQALVAENAELKAEKTASDKLEAYNANLMEKWFKPLADEVADSRVREARMEEQIKCIEKTHALELALVRKDVELVNKDLTCCCTANANAIANVAAILSKVTNTIIPITAIYPTPATATPAAAA